MSLRELTLAHREALRPLRFGCAPGSAVACTLQPLDYAWPVHSAYLSRYGAGHKRALLLGMNPGPHGMGQTGVPFGDPTMVREYLGLRGEIAQPEGALPSFRVLGLHSTRREGSGTRLWGAVAARHPRAEDFFARAWVHAYCPLLFLDAGGRNVAADKLRCAEREAMERVCDAHLRELCTLLRVTQLVAIGQYAERCARRALAAHAPTIVRILHPSPASPQANRGWVEQAQRSLHAAGIDELL